MKNIVTLFGCLLLFFRGFSQGAIRFTMGLFLNSISKVQAL